MLQDAWLVCRHRRYAVEADSTLLWGHGQRTTNTFCLTAPPGQFVVFAPRDPRGSLHDLASTIRTCSLPHVASHEVCRVGVQAGLAPPERDPPGYLLPDGSSGKNWENMVEDHSPLSPGVGRQARQNSAAKLKRTLPQSSVNISPNWPSLHKLAVELWNSQQNCSGEG